MGYTVNHVVGMSVSQYLITEVEPLEGCQIGRLIADLALLTAKN